jgi:hypothetical protein
MRTHDMNKSLIERRKAAMAALVERRREHNNLASDYWRRYQRELDRASRYDAKRLTLKQLLYLDENKLRLVETLLSANGTLIRLSRGDAAHASRIDRAYVVKARPGWYAASERLLDMLSYGDDGETTCDDEVIDLGPQQSAEERAWIDERDSLQQEIATSMSVPDVDDKETIKERREALKVAERWNAEVIPPEPRRSTIQETVEKMINEDTGDDGQEV